MKLLLEKAKEFSVKTENEAGGKGYFIEGIFLQGDVVNGNKRIYPLEILSREAERYNDEMIKTNRAVGEADHPDTCDINMDRVSHKIVSLTQDGKNFIGKAKILDTPMGRIVKNFIDEDIQIGVSSRALGSLKEADGVSVVQEDLRIFTAADIVMDPSAPNAFVNAVMENKEWVWENGMVVEKKIEDIKKEIENAPAARLRETETKAFQDFIEALRKRAY